MNLILKSPIPLLKGRNLLVASYSVRISYNDNYGLPIEREISVVTFGGEVKLDEWSEPARIQTETPPIDSGSMFVYLQNKINHCVNIAEDLHGKLRRIVLNMKHNDEEWKTKVRKSDYLNLKDIFSKHLKKDNEIKKIDAYSSNIKIKKLTKLFNQFILDRNIYTHGHLRIKQDDWTHVIEYADHISKKKEFAIINDEILTSYVEVNKLLNTLMEDYQKRWTVNNEDFRWWKSTPNIPER